MDLLPQVASEELVGDGANYTGDAAGRFSIASLCTSMNPKVPR